MSEDKKDSEEPKGSSDGSKSLSVTPAITALLKPTADYLGTEIRDYVKDAVEDLKKKKREKNLNVHVDAVKRSLKDKPPLSDGQEVSLQQLSFFEDWVDHVQDVDPADRELSSIWERLLAQSARGEMHSSEVIDVLKTLSPSEARFLVEMSERIPVFPMISGTIRAEDRFLAKRLEQRQVLEKDYVFGATLLTFVAASLVAMYYIAKDLALPLEPPIIIATLAATAVASSVFLRAGMSRWKLTWLGRELVSTSENK